MSDITDTTPGRTFTHRIELDTIEYLDLMRIVMRYGTGTGEGESTSQELRRRLAQAQIVHHAPYEKPTYPAPRPVVIEQEEHR